MGATFQREPFAVAWPDIAPLVAAHWHEVAYPGGFPADDTPQVDVEAYQQAEDAGRLVFFTNRKAGKLLAYAAFWIGPWPQRKGLIGAWQEAVYMDKGSRHGGEGIAFLSRCDEALRALGVAVVHHSVRAGRDFTPVLKRLGYSQAEIVYTKNLGA